MLVAQLAELGVRRISVGGALARTAWHGFLQAALQLAGQGKFNAFAQSTPAAELNQMLGTSATDD